MARFGQFFHPKPLAATAVRSDSFSGGNTTFTNQRLPDPPASLFPIINKPAGIPSDVIERILL